MQTPLTGVTFEVCSLGVAPDTLANLLRKENLQHCGGSWELRLRCVKRDSSKSGLRCL